MPASCLQELPAGQALTALGMEASREPGSAGEGPLREPVSLENIGQIDPNRVVFAGTLGKASVQTSAGQHGRRDASTPLWKKLPRAPSAPSVLRGRPCPRRRFLRTSAGGYLLMDGIVSSIKPNRPSTPDIDGPHDRVDDLT